MSKIKITAISKKDMPSQYGGTWQIVRIKVDGQGEEIFELNGFGKNEKEKIAIGSELQGYFSERTWQGKNGSQTTKTFNKITAEYVYDLLMEMKGVKPTDPKLPEGEDDPGF